MNPESQKSTSSPSPDPRKNLHDLLGWVEKEPAKLLEVFPRLSFEEQLNLIRFTSGQLRQELLVTSPYAAKLVSRLPVQEVYITLKEIGIPDALPLLSLMTAEQLQFWNDLETWEKNDFSPARFLHILELMQQCGEDRLFDWLDTIDPEALVLLLRSSGTVSRYDLFAEPAEESDLPPFVTFDGMNRYHFLEEKTRPHLETILRILHTHDPDRCRMVLESAYRDLSSEVREEALRFREGRLAEWGIPVFDDAVEIYHPLADKDFFRLLETTPCERPREEALSVLYPVRWLPPESFLRNTLRYVSGRPEADHIRMELAALGNKIVVADGLEPDNPHLMKAALQKAAGCLTIALEHLAGSDAEKAAEWISKAWLSYLFRLGYGRIHDLTRKAQSLLDLSRFRWADQHVSLAGSPFDETLWALTRPRPLFFEGESEESLFGFRDFAGLADVRIVGERLQVVRSLSDLFSGRNLTPDKIKTLCLEGGMGDRADEIKWASVLHTMWMTHALGGPEEFRLVLPEELPALLDKSFVQDPDSNTRRLDPGHKASLAEWIHRETKVQGALARDILDAWIRDGMSRLEAELGGLAADRVPDPRYIQCICVRQRS